RAGLRPCIEAGVVHVLYQYAVEDAFVFPLRGNGPFLLKDDAVLFGFQYRQRVIVISGGYEYFEEKLVDFFRHFFGDGLVGSEYTTEGAFGVACEGGRPCLGYVVTLCYSADVGVLDDGEGSTFEFRHYLAGSV